MIRTQLSPTLAAAFLLLSGCQGELDANEVEADSNAQASAEGKAEEGRISIKAPGFDLAINLPKQLATEASRNNDSKIIYPGATVAGLHVAAGAAEGKGAGSEVEMRLSTADPVDRVLAWYRDPARAEGFTLDQVERAEGGYLLTGTQKRDRHPFKLRLLPKAGGGTDGRLTIRHKD
ncbi:MAG TPA: hypothetical protein VGB59_02265 [Allosphingosinicella sp.]